MRSQMKGLAVLGLLVMPCITIAKEVRPPMPIAQDLQVELRLLHPRFEADISGLNKALAEATGPGLVADMAADSDSQRREAADRRAGTLDGKLDNYPFEDRVESQLHRDFSAAGLSPNPVFSVVRGADIATQGGLCVERKGLFVLTPRYWMSANFLELTIEMNARYVDRYTNKKGECIEDLRYQRSYAWRYQMTKIKGIDANGNAERWSQIERRRLFDMLDQGVVQMIALMNYDYSESGRIEDEKIRYGVSAAPKPEGAIVKQGWVGAFEGIPGLVGMVPVDWTVPPSPFQGD